MISVQNLSFSYPTKELFDELSFCIDRGEHCALIGTSGSGKTTLIDIICGNNRCLYDGKIVFDEPIRIGHTSQFYNREDSEINVFDFVAQDFIKAQEEIDRICDKMATAENFDEVMEEYQSALDKFDAMGGNSYENEILKKLNLIGLLGHKDMSISLLSGGEFKLIQLIKEMLLGHDLLIMDEPDVFLDFENLVALKNLMNSHKQTLLVITHNRYLLNQCFNKIIHLEDRKIQEFNGKYIEYNLSILEKKLEIQELAYADALEVERNEKLIDNLREIATEIAESVHGKSLKARVKYHERLLARQIKEPFIYVKTPNFDFMSNEVENTEKDIISVENFSISYEDVLLENVNFSVKYGEKVAMIGANGTGKTSLLREIYKNENEKIKIDDGITVCYLSQIVNETLKEENTIYDEFFDLGFKSYTQIEEYLDEYNVDHEKLNTKISTLSGGEKCVIQIAKISSIKADLLILDEPSSHLDIYSQIALEQAITDFDGSVIMVSHDFYFVTNCMDFVIVLENKTARKTSTRKFRQKIYAKYFPKDYLIMQEKYTLTVNKLEESVYNKNFEKAKKLLEECKVLAENL